MARESGEEVGEAGVDTGEECLVPLCPHRLVSVGAACGERHRPILLTNLEVSDNVQGQAGPGWKGKRGQHLSQ